MGLPGAVGRAESLPPSDELKLRVLSLVQGVAIFVLVMTSIAANNRLLDSCDQVRGRVAGRSVRDGAAIAAPIAVGVAAGTGDAVDFVVVNGAALSPARSRRRARQ